MNGQERPEAPSAQRAEHDSAPVGALERMVAESTALAGNGSERLRAFHRLPASLQDAAWRRLAAEVEDRERPAREAVVA